MGIQAKDRQDQLFEVRIHQSQLFHAVALAMTGSPVDARVAEGILIDLASDPLCARILLRSIPDDIAEKSDVLIRVIGVARRALSPRPGGLLAAA